MRELAVTSLSVLLCVSISSIVGCGPAVSGAPSPAEDRTDPPVDSPPAEIPGCDRPPAAAPATPHESADFDVTADRIAAGTVRVYPLGATLISSTSEGGIDTVSLHNVNACGLWLAERHQGSESGGDIGADKTVITLVRGDAEPFRVERLGARVDVTLNDDGTVTGTLAAEIIEYVGE